MAEAATAPRIVVIGGGITGLCAAFYSTRLYKEAGLSPQVTLLEASERLGGKIQTLRRDGFVIERGPDSFLGRKLPMVELAKELGIENELVPTDPKAKKTYIVHGGTLHRIPPGLVLGVPTQWKPFIASSLISPLGKLRASLDLALPASKGNEDESLGRFLRRRLGDQVVDRVAEPLLSGIYAGDADRLSLMATFPQFRTAERKHGSLILGMGRGGGATRSGATSEEAIPAHARGSVFLSYRNGLSTVIEKLEQAIRQEGATIRLRTGAAAVRKAENGLSVTLEGGEMLQADIVIVTAPLTALTRLLPDVQESGRFADMEYASVANIVLAYRQEQLTKVLDGSGFVIPRKEGRFITACTWTSSKWAHTAPKDGVLIRCYVGRSDDERWRGMDDETLGRAVRSEIEALMGITAVPEFIDINRLPFSMPQYRVGHLDDVRVLREALQHKTPGVYATGAGFEGVGLPDCIHQAKQAVLQSLTFMKSGALTNRS